MFVTKFGLSIPSAHKFHTARSRFTNKTVIVLSVREIVILMANLHFNCK